MIKHIYKLINKYTIHCFNVECSENTNLSILLNLLDIEESYTDFSYNNYTEYGPYIEMISPWCTNALNILRKCGVVDIFRIELSILIRNDKFKQSMFDKMTHTIYPNPISSFTIDKIIEKPYVVEDIEEENKKHNLGFDEQDLEFYKNIFHKLGRNPTNIELHDLAQSNSEHSRHWFFNGVFYKNGEKIEGSLMKMIKNTLQCKSKENNISTIAFSDNSSAIEGYQNKYFGPKIDSNLYTLKNYKYNPVFTAETHNFPTSIAPFPGAATGTGGRIRDNQSVGRGGLCIAGLAGYSVGDINYGDYIDKNIRTLIEASNGASDYGNKFGEPVIGGFCRSFGMTMDDNERIEYVKPIMFSAGVGQMNDIHTLKETNLTNDILVVRLGGPTYRIGIGGGAASSRDQNTKNMDQDFNAVQRGDPEMENKLNRVIRNCIEMGEDNPILSIHDQGAGGMANVTKEIVHPNGAKINLKNVIIGDQTMSVLEIWISEHQEQDTVLIYRDSLLLVDQICQRENLPIAVIGQIDNSGKLSVISADDELVVDFDLEDILGKGMPHKNYLLEEKVPYLHKLEKDINLLNDINDKTIGIEIIITLNKVLENISVCSKRFLVNKVDRSVTGLIAQQQCCGPLQTPLTDYSLVAQSYFNKTGIVTAIGERPIVGLLDASSMARMSIGEMLTNMMFCKIDSLENVRCSGNWMWAMKMAGEKDRLYNAVKAMCESMKELGIALDGGKDSLSMSYHDSLSQETIKSPGTLVISGYTRVNDITKKVTPDFKRSENSVYYLNLSGGKYRLGGSIFYQTYDLLGKEHPDFEIKNHSEFKNVFNKVQELVNNSIIKSGHDISDGGFITSLLEMCFAGDLGFKGNHQIDVDIYSFLYSEELGIIFEVEPENDQMIMDIFKDVRCYKIGEITSNNIFDFRLYKDSKLYKICEEMTTFRSMWENGSHKMELLQTNKKCADQEYTIYNNMSKLKNNFEIYSNNYDLNTDYIQQQYHPRIAIIREEGSNGDREMAAAFYTAGFDVYDICMNDLLNNNVNLDDYRGIVFVGGFSYSDVFGAARGWYQVIISNPKIKEDFDRFYKRPDTFSLGVCNGCQLMALLGWIPECKLVSNNSGRFESRFSRVKINNQSIMLKNMKDSVLGIWVAHGEGRFLLDKTIHSRSISMQYVDENNIITNNYPDNPNGSDMGIAGLCSSDGRHLAMMPHPERCFLDWQKPIANNGGEFGPWFMMFKNAYLWCLNN